MAFNFSHSGEDNKRRRIWGKNGKEYEILKELHSGGMGYICMAKEIASGMQLVAKTPKFTGGTNDKIMLEKLRIEAQIIESLQHKNIISYITESDLGDNFYLFLEYVDGTNLLDMFKEKRADEQFVLWYGKVLLSALSHLHGSNPYILHRDVNPKNIMITRSDSRLILIDFGAAKKGFIQLEDNQSRNENEDSNNPPTLIGTPGYAAPEQFTTGIVTPATDIYGCGSTLFYLLTSKNPRNFMDSGGAILRSPRDVNPLVSKSISDIITKAMATDPVDRFETASDMIDALSDRMPQKMDSSYIVIQNKKYKIDDQIVIGKLHNCDDRCISKDYDRSPDIPIEGPYISKHHARITRDSIGQSWIEDMGSRNSTALSHNGGRSFQILKPFIRNKLRNKDIVALAYNPSKGPYVTFMYVGS